MSCLVKRVFYFLKDLLISLLFGSRPACTDGPILTIRKPHITSFRASVCLLGVTLINTPQLGNQIPENINKGHELISSNQTTLSRSFIYENNKLLGSFLFCLFICPFVYIDTLFGE